MELLGILLLWALTGLLIGVTILPISKVPLGAIRGLDFPRQQYFLLALVMAVCIFVLVPGWLGGLGGPLVVALALVHLFYIAKFTPIWPVQSVSASPQSGLTDPGRISLIAANVKLSNRDYDRLIDLCLARQPDILLAIEVDDKWIAALRAALDDDYPHRVEVPQDNGYGMAVFSRLPLSDTSVRELITKKVPSVRTTVTLRNRDRFRLYVVHPEPPVIDHDTMGRDSEIAMVGLEAAKDELPAMVAGDLNDVAWSTTTRRFQRLSRLMDPRVGRGFFNTFSATMPWMRWPLDHLFHDPRFRLVEMARLPKIGSDHFPMWFALILADEAAQVSDPGEADSEEAFRAKRMIVKERNRDRTPIGEDWEAE